jgi:tRNA dimethylallyltransferase
LPDPLSNPLLLAVAGPTASGKTQLAVALARKLHTEVISFDSRQFYQEMRIGTAVPSEDELAGVKHHFIQQLSIHQDYSVADYAADAQNTLKNLFKKYPIVVAVGGSGLYLKALSEGLDRIPEVPLEVREKLDQQLLSEGLNPLLAQLKRLDPLTYKRIDQHNPRRVLRALEVCLYTGKAYSSYMNEGRTAVPFQTATLVLCPKRNDLYTRINERTLEMMRSGWLDEARQLYAYRHLNALNTLGYKELFLHLEGKWGLDQAIAEIQKKTRWYAKRQTTWFKKQVPEASHWFEQAPDLLQFAEQIIPFPGAE